MKKIYLLLLCLMLAAGAVAQEKSSKKRKKPSGAYNKQSKENEKFLNKQFWLGLKGGVNLANTTVIKSYTAISRGESDPDIRKQYDGFKQLGSQIGIEVSFYISGFSLSFQPTYQHSVFSYTNEYTWTGTETNNLSLTYDQEHKVDHLQLPFLIKYEITGNKFRPYLQIGGYSAILLNAVKSVTITGTDNASGGVNEFVQGPITVGADDLFAKSHWGLIAGAGAYYNLGNVRLNLDIMYKYGMSNITSSENRYSNDRLAGVGDAMDDMTLDNISFSIGCLFPMRYLENGFKSLDRK
jgi:hypothetical protein